MSLKVKVERNKRSLKIDKDDICYRHDGLGEKIWVGQGATAVVYSGFVKTDSENYLVVAVKKKGKSESNTYDVLLEGFLHLIAAQHSRIRKLYGMHFLPLHEQHELMVV